MSLWLVVLVGLEQLGVLGEEARSFAISLCLSPCLVDGLGVVGSRVGSDGVLGQVGAGRLEGQVLVRGGGWLQGRVGVGRLEGEVLLGAEGAGREVLEAGGKGAEGLGAVGG